MVDISEQLITSDQLKAIMPGLHLDKAEFYAPYINDAMAEFEINTPERIAAFIAQGAHETNQLLWLKELASGKEYEGRKDLGNVNPGDGVRYKGRGFFQLTGRSNYSKCGDALGVDLINNPELAEKPELTFRIGGWFWSTHNLNDLADINDDNSFEHITRRINGGINGLSSRRLYWATAKQILGC